MFNVINGDMFLWCFLFVLFIKFVFVWSCVFVLGKVILFFLFFFLSVFIIFMVVRKWFNIFDKCMGRGIINDRMNY